MSLDKSTHRERLEAQLGELRPLLHRYCTRLVGSVFDGEDVVQDVLARALVAVEDIGPDTPLRPWLLRIAHNRAIDHLRSRRVRQAEQHTGEPTQDELGEAPEEAVARQQAVQAAFTQFLELPTSQRAAVILKDVLGYSLQDISELLDLSVNAVKAALSRGRSRLEQINASPRTPLDALSPSPEAAMFASLFNAGNWDALRSLLADNVQLNQASRGERRGRADVSQFFTIYSAVPDLVIAPARIADGSEVLAVFDQKAAEPLYFMKVDWRGGEIVRIRDFRYAPYALEGAHLTISPPTAGHGNAASSDTTH